MACNKPKGFLVSVEGNINSMMEVRWIMSNLNYGA